MKKILVLCLLLAGCAQVAPDYSGFYTALQSTCTPTVITLPAPNGGVYTIPVDAGNGDACKQGMQTAFQMNQSGWERFGVATVNMVGSVGITAVPYAAIGYGMHEGYKAAGDNISSSYNSQANQANPIDNSDHSSRPVDNSDRSNHVDNSDRSNRPIDNSDHRSNYDNPVAVIPPVVVETPVVITPVFQPVGVQP